MSAVKHGHSGSRRSARSKFFSGQHDFTLEEARNCLGQLAELAMQGEAVYIVSGDHRFRLQPTNAAAALPLPDHDGGYFAGCHTDSEIRSDTSFGASALPFGPDA